MSAVRPRRLTWLDVLPETLAAIVVLIAGLWESEQSRDWASSTMPPPVIAILVGVAVLVSRRLPSLALGLAVLVGLAHVIAGVPLMLVEVAFGLVMFSVARWGRPVTVALAGVLIVAAVPIAITALDYPDLGRIYDYLPNRAIAAARSSTGTRQVVASIAGAVVLMIPWLIGLVLRLLAGAIAARDAEHAALEEADRAHREAAQAQEIARLEEERSRLAHDVHDVVGHSLAVILAQAESGQYATEVATLKTTMATIATSARASLQDVRHVLRTGEGRSGTLAELIAGVRTSGYDVVESVTGTPRPLPPDLETVAYRVLQEMLTNALRHGRREGTLRIEQEWGDLLVLRVSNPVPVAAQPTATSGTRAAGADRSGEVVMSPPGQGLTGMRQRLAAIGGRLQVRPGEPFTVTATMPMRGEGR